MITWASGARPSLGPRDRVTQIPELIHKVELEGLLAREHPPVPDHLEIFFRHLGSPGPDHPEELCLVLADDRLEDSEFFLGRGPEGRPDVLLSPDFTVSDSTPPSPGAPGR